MAQVHSDIHRILDKLAAARRRSMSCFGSESHRFRLGPPLSETAVAAFEAQHGVTLPADYRDFLLHAGHGGAGPYYGLLPLKRWADALLGATPGALARPSPLLPDLTYGALPGRPQGWHDGALALVSQGCTFYALLILSGPCRGRVVYVSLDASDHATPFFVHHMDFVSWYERWLDELLAGFETSWFGVDLPGSDEQLVAIAGGGGTPEHRGDALRSLMRRPTLSAEALAAGGACLRDPAAVVRQRALDLLGGKAEAAAVVIAGAEVAALTADPAPAVRRSAIKALRQWPGAAWDDAARALLGDDDADVMFQALCLLKEEKLLRLADLLPRLRDDNATIRRSALWAAGEIDERPSSAWLPPELLADPDSDVRRYAVCAIDQSGQRPDHASADKGRWTPRLIEMLAEGEDLILLSWVVRTLGRLGDPAAVLPLVALAAHPDGFIRQDVATALGEIGDLRAKPALKELLKDRSKPERHGPDGGRSTIHTVASKAREALRRLRRSPRKRRSGT